MSEIDELDQLAESVVVKKPDQPFPQSAIKTAYDEIQQEPEIPLTREEAKKMLPKTEIVNGEEVGTDSLGEVGDFDFSDFGPNSDTVAKPVINKNELGSKPQIKEDDIKWNIWADKDKYGISMETSAGTQLFEVPEPVYKMFTRMVERMREMGRETAQMSENYNKLKRNMVQ